LEKNINFENRKNSGNLVKIWMLGKSLEVWKNFRNWEET